MKKIIILGAGGNSIDIFDTLLELNRACGSMLFELTGFLDDDREKWGKPCAGATVLGPLSSAMQYRDEFFIHGIGNVANFRERAAIGERTGIPFDRWETVIHPKAYVSGRATVGRGCAIFANVTISANARIGNHVLVLPNASIAHDSVIGDYTSIAAGVRVSGRVVVGESVYLGTAAAIHPDVSLGARCLVGMGSIVLGNVQPGVTVTGVVK